MFGFGKGKGLDKGHATPTRTPEGDVPAYLRVGRIEMKGDLAQLPWPEPRPSVAANYAQINLRDRLLEILNLEGRGVHLESLMVCIGALAGFSAALAVARKGMPVIVADGADGKRYLLGDSLNAFLLGEGGYPLGLWPVVALAATQSGRSRTELEEDIKDIIRRVVRSLGGAEFGVMTPRPGHEPQIAPVEALRALWARAEQILDFKEHIGAEGRPLEVEHWPAICAIVAQQYVTMGKDTLDPALAAMLVMEAAIVTAKLDPRQPI